MKEINGFQCTYCRKRTFIRSKMEVHEQLCISNPKVNEFHKVNEIVNVSLKKYKINIDKFYGRNRNPLTVDLRCCWAKTLRHKHNLSYLSICQILCLGDHTTAMSLIDRYHRLKDDPTIIELTTFIDNLSNSIHNITTKN